MIGWTCSERSCSPARVRLPWLIETLIPCRSARSIPCTVPRSADQGADSVPGHRSRCPPRVPDAKDAPAPSVTKEHCWWAVFPTTGRRDSGRVSGLVASIRSCRLGYWSIWVLNYLLILAASLCVAVLVFWCFPRFRRTAVGSRPAVFALAETADAERVRRQAQEAVVAFGAELEGAPPSDDLDRALDAYQAATMVLDAATSLVDLAGVLVLVNRGRGGPPLCFFNPLHGPSAQQVAWRLIGTREQLQVHACTSCRRAISRRRPPAVLPDTVNKKRVPYLDVDPERSVWAATGFGVFSDDLVERILRGDLRRRRTGA